MSEQSGAPTGAQEQDQSKSPTAPPQPTGAGQGEPAKEEPRFTQADLDRIIQSRIAPLKEKADKYDQQIEASKTEAQRQADAAAALKAENETSHLLARGDDSVDHREGYQRGNTSFITHRTCC